jgi:hypothetical protein
MRIAERSAEGKVGGRISRGKTDRLRRTPAGFTTPALDGCGLRDHCALVRPFVRRKYRVLAGKALLVPVTDCHTMNRYFGAELHLHQGILLE